MLASVTLNDPAGSPVTLHETATRYITKASGLLGVSPTRDVVRPRPQQHGGIDDTKFTDPHLVVLEGECFSAIGGPAGIDAAFAEFHAVVAPMLATLETGPALLKWQEGQNGLALQKTVKLASDVDPVLDESEPSVKWQAQFRAADPRAYSQTLTTATGAPLSTAAGGIVWPDPWPWVFAPSTGGLCPVTNPGNRKTPPIFRIFGGASGQLVILRQSTQAKITLNGTILNGDFVDVDVAQRKVLLNGSSNAISMLDPARTAWSDMQLPAAGAETFQLIASSFDSAASLSTIFRAAYA